MSEQIELKKVDSNSQGKLSQFHLTPLQTILINRKMPFGFKLETEENIMKSMEFSKKIVPKIKPKTQSERIIPKEPSRHHNEIPNKKTNEDGLLLIKQKCELAFKKLRRDESTDNFYYSDTNNTLSLSVIEKNISNMKYRSTTEFISDLRTVWDQNLMLYSNNNQMKEIIPKMKRITEELFFETPYNTMSLKEKNNLGNNIRILSTEHQKGLINLLRNVDNVEHTKQSFEFDLDKLSENKLRELEKYVNDCLHRSGYNSRSQTTNPNPNPIPKPRTDLSNQNKVLNNNTVSSNKSIQGTRQQMHYTPIASDIQKNMSMPNQGNHVHKENTAVETPAIKKDFSNQINNNPSTNKKTVLSDIDSLSNSNSDSDSKIDDISSV